MAAEFIPTVMSRGFHAGPVFGIFGAAVAAAKIHGLDADQINSAIAQCVNLAAGNLEGARSGGRSLREGGAVRNALLAVAMARHGTPGGETTLEGDAGFYHAYTGNNLGQLRYSYTGRQPRRYQQDHQKSRAELDLSRDAVSHLFHRWLQYRPCRCDGTVVRGAQYHLSRHRPHRGRGELARDRIPKPRLPYPRQRRQTASRQHPVFLGVWRSDARLSPVARRTAGPGRNRIRPKYWT